MPLYRIKDDRLGGAFSPSSGVVDLKNPITRLTGSAPSDPLAYVVWTVDQTLHVPTADGKKGRRGAARHKKGIDEAIKEGLIELNEDGKKESSARVTAKGSEWLIAQGLNVGDVMDNILMNMTTLIDAATKNHAALMAVDDLIETGSMSFRPVAAAIGLGSRIAGMGIAIGDYEG